MYRVGIMGCGRIASTMEDESDGVSHLDRGRF